MRDNLWLAMVALEQAELPTASSVFDYLQTTWPDLPPAQVSRESAGVITGSIGEASAALTLIPQPIPWEHLAGPCEAAWYWPEAAERMRQHRAHILITLLDEGRDRVEKALLLTRLIAAVAADAPATGVFWGPGRLVHPPSAFIELSRDATRDQLPLFLWIDFRVENDPAGGLLLFTTGLEPLGQPEIEVRRFQGDIRTLRDAVYNVAHYLLDKRQIVHDSDTMQLSDTMRVIVQIVPSLLDASQTVIHLKFD